ncbi:MAG: hypothetical protein LBU58_00545, partial [Clostridiales bacterium]|jgi:lysophospholipase L1-like esterase|nr:hypothetical protein [Clostridiales bacterium]
MDRYGAAMARVAAAHKLPFVDTQAVFNEKLRHVHANAIAWDRVHPNSKGHILLAAAFLNAIGFEWPK